MTFQWETWIVCEIEEILGADARKASDDSYTLALLPTGFTWGFSIEKTGPGTTEADYTVAKLAFKWLAAPTAPFLNSWKTVYGVARPPIGQHRAGTVRELPRDSGTWVWLVAWNGHSPGCGGQAALPRAHEQRQGVPEMAERSGLIGGLRCGCGILPLYAALPSPATAR